MEKKAIILVIPNTDDDDILSMLKYVKFRNILSVTDTKQVSASKINKIITSFNSPVAVADKVEKWQKESGNEIVGVIPFDEEHHYRFSEEISRRFYLDFYSREILDAASNKYLQRNILNKAGIRTPKFRLIDKKSDLSGEVYPNVLKIMYGHASLFNFLNKNERELRNNIDLILKGHKKEFNEVLFKKHTARFKGEEIMFDSKEKFLLEEFVFGNEYSCDYAIMPDGLVKVIRVCRKIRNKEFGYFDGFVLFNPDEDPASEFKLKELEEFCTKVANAMKINFGVCMMDFIFNKEFIIIETTTRMGVASFIDLMGAVYGYTSLNVAVSLAIKEKIDIKIPKETGLVVMFYKDGYGTLKKIDYSGLTQKGLCLISYENYYLIGHKIKKVRKVDHWVHLMGYGLFMGSALREAEKRVAQIQSKVYIEVEPFLKR